MGWPPAENDISSTCAIPGHRTKYKHPVVAGIGTLPATIACRVREASGLLNGRGSTGAAAELLDLVELSPAQSVQAHGRHSMTRTETVVMFSVVATLVTMVCSCRTKQR